MGTTFANCSDALSKGYANIPRGAPGYAAKLDRDGDGIACEQNEGTGTSSSGSGSTSSSSSSKVAGATLASTGSSRTFPLAMLATGLLMLGVAAMRTEVGRRWYATAGGTARYTIDHVRPKR